MILLVVVCAGGLLLRAELPSVSYLFTSQPRLAPSPPPATSCCSCDPTQKGDGEMGHSQHRLHWGKLDWTMLGLSPYRPISHVLLLNRIQKMKYHINMLTVQKKREFMIHFVQFK